VRVSSWRHEERYARETVSAKRADDGLAARRLAFAVLQRVETSSAFADALLGEAFVREPLPAVDRGLATRLVYGTLAWRRRLDWIADHWVRPEMAELDPEIQVSIRLGLFQLFFCDRIPTFAAVDTSVELAKSFRRGRAAPLVNAVLRRASADGAPVPPSGDDVESLGLRFSHPDWLVAAWLRERRSEETAKLLAANNEAAPLVLRASTASGGAAALIERLAVAGADSRRGRHSPLAVEIHGAVPERLLDRPTSFFPQGEASQLVPMLLGTETGDRVLDACAAPGGKATEIAELAPTAVVVAGDRRFRGVQRIAHVAAALGLRRVRTVVEDGARPPFRAEAFDRVLVDAPCSGTGTLRSHPEIRWRLGLADVSRLAKRQRDLLAGVAPLVRPGGVLVYATCSLLREENDSVVDGFLASRKDFVRAEVPSGFPASARGLFRDGALRTAPHDGGLDGFFAVPLLRRR
jgi:16S rRNA (cytosine967-C5)-methyltransferase